MIPQIIKYFRFEPITDSDGTVYMAPVDFKAGENFCRGYDLEPFTIKYVVHRDIDLQPDTFVITVDNYFFQNPTNSLAFRPNTSTKLTDQEHSFQPTTNHVIAIGPVPESYDSWTNPILGTESYCYEDHWEYLSDGPFFGFVKSWNQVGADKTEITCGSFLKVISEHQLSSNFLLNEYKDDVNDIQVYYEYKDDIDFTSAPYFAPKDIYNRGNDGYYRISSPVEPLDEHDYPPKFPRFEFFTGTFTEGYAASKIIWRLLQEVGWCRENYNSSLEKFEAVPIDGNPGVSFINPFQRFSCTDTLFNPIIMGTCIGATNSDFKFRAFDVDGLRYEYPAEATGTEITYGEKYFLSYDPSKQSILFNIKSICDANGLFMTVTCCPRFEKRANVTYTDIVWDYEAYGSFENLKKWGVSVGFHPKVVIRRNMAQVFDFDELTTATDIVYPVYETDIVSFNALYYRSIRKSDATWSVARGATSGDYLTSPIVMTSPGYEIGRVPLVFDVSAIPPDAVINSAELRISYSNSGSSDVTVYIVGDSTLEHPLSTASQKDFNKEYYGNFDASHTYGSFVAYASTSSIAYVTLNSYGLNNITPGGTAKFMLVQSNDYNDSAPVASRSVYISTAKLYEVNYTIEGSLNTYLEQLKIMPAPPLLYGAFNNPPSSDYKTQVLVKGIKWDKDQSDVINKVLVKYGQGDDYSRTYVELPFPDVLEYFYIIDFSGMVKESMATVGLSIIYLDDSGNTAIYAVSRLYPVGATSYDIVRDIINAFRGNNYFQMIYSNDTLLIFPLNDNTKEFWNAKYLNPEYDIPEIVMIDEDFATGAPPDGWIDVGVTCNNPGGECQITPTSDNWSTSPCTNYIAYLFDNPVGSHQDFDLQGTISWSAVDNSGMSMSWVGTANGGYDFIHHAGFYDAWVANRGTWHVTGAAGAFNDYALTGTMTVQITRVSGTVTYKVDGSTRATSYNDYSAFDRIVFCNQSHPDPSASTYTTALDDLLLTVNPMTYGEPVTVTISYAGTNGEALGFVKEFVQEEPGGFEIARDSQKLNGIKAAKISLPEVNNLSDVIKVADNIFRKLGREKYRCSVQCSNSDNWQLPILGLYNIQDNTHTKRVVNTEGASIKLFVFGNATSSGYINLAIPSPYSYNLVGIPVSITNGDSSTVILGKIETVFNTDISPGAGISATVDVAENSITFNYSTDIIGNIDYKNKSAFDEATICTTVSGITIQRIINPPSQFKETIYNEYLPLLSYDSDSTKVTYNCIFGIPNEDLSNIINQSITWIADVEKSQ